MFGSVLVVWSAALRGKRGQHGCGLIHGTRPTVKFMSAKSVFVVEITMEKKSNWDASSRRGLVLSLTEGAPDFGVGPQHTVERPGSGSEEKVVASLKGTSDWRADWRWQIWGCSGLQSSSTAENYSWQNRGRESVLTFWDPTGDWWEEDVAGCDWNGLS